MVASPHCYLAMLSAASGPMDGYYRLLFLFWIATAIYSLGRCRA